MFSTKFFPSFIQYLSGQSYCSMLFYLRTILLAVMGKKAAHYLFDHPFECHHHLNLYVPNRTLVICPLPLSDTFSSSSLLFFCEFLHLPYTSCSNQILRRHHWSILFPLTFILPGLMVSMSQITFSNY